MSSVSSWRVIHLFYSVNRHILMSLCNILQIQFNLLDTMRKGEPEGRNQNGNRDRCKTGRGNAQQTAGSNCQQGPLPAQQCWPRRVHRFAVKTGLRRRVRERGGCQPATVSPQPFPCSRTGFLFCVPPFSPLQIVSSRDSFFMELLWISLLF